MGDSETQWQGGSGNPYTFDVYILPWEPKASQNGNYIFANVVGNVWHAVYVGQGDLRERYDEHMRNGCVTGNGATHYHCHLNRDEQSRLREEDDLLEGHPEAYAPTGCNRKLGG